MYRWPQASMNANLRGRFLVSNVAMLPQSAARCIMYIRYKGNVSITKLVGSAKSFDFSHNNNYPAFAAMTLHKVPQFPTLCTCVHLSRVIHVSKSKAWHSLRLFVDRAHDISEHS